MASVKNVVAFYRAGRNGIVQAEHDMLGDVIPIEVWEIAPLTPALAAHFLR